MKCKCPTCKSVLSINRNGLANLKNPRFNCPSCQTKILIKPSRGQCGSCLHIFAFYDFMFPKENAIAACPNCKQRNKLKIKY